MIIGVAGFIVIYPPIISTPDMMSKSGYRLVVSLGIHDVIDCFCNGFIQAAYKMRPEQQTETDMPTIRFFGSMQALGWWSYDMHMIVMSLNRVTALYCSPPTFKKLWDGKATYLWIALAWGFGR